MLHLRAVSRKTARSLKTVKITVVLGRLGAPVPLILHLSWRWRLKNETGLGRKKKTEQKAESKVASLKNRIYKDRLSQLPKNVPENARESQKAPQVGQYYSLVARIAATLKSQIASDCNRNSKKITATPKTSSEAKSLDSGTASFAWFL